MTVPDIPAPTPEARMAYPKTPVQEFTGVPLPDVQGAFDQAIADGGSGVLYPMSDRITEAETLLNSPQGFGIDGFNIESGASAGWPTDMEPPGDYETPLHPGPHGG
jgi:hypothetical protein